MTHRSFTFALVASAVLAASVAHAVCPTTHVHFKVPDGSVCGSFRDASGNQLTPFGTTTPALECGVLYMGGGRSLGDQLAPQRVQGAFDRDFAAGDASGFHCEDPQHLPLIPIAGGNTAFGPPVPVVAPFLPPGVGACMVQRFGDGRCLGNIGVYCTTNAECASAAPCTASTGMLDVTAGTLELDVPVVIDTYLTLQGQGDGNPASAAFEPCPLCVGGFCTGGASAGHACTTSAASGVSNDCLPNASQLEGHVYFDALFRNAPVTVSAPLLAHGRVFCGYCATSTAQFLTPAIPCTSDIACAPYAPDLSCQQTYAGAFGSVTAASISEGGTPAGNLADGAAHPTTVSSVFCLPPAIYNIVAPDDPGPGALGLKAELSITTSCGDFVLNPGEDCDDGNTVDGDSCSSTCRFPCGDGTVQGTEECDDGNQTDNDGCDSNCTLPRCGNGVTNPGLGEECDDRNADDHDDCTNACRNAVCGDGILHSAGTFTEMCDNGAGNGGSSCCSTTCSLKAAGMPCGLDANPCTRDACDGVGTTCQHTAISGCTPGGSTEGVVGGPAMLCDGGTIDTATNTCVLTPPPSASATTAELRIPLSGPPYALPEATVVTVANVTGSNICSSAFLLGSGSGPGNAKMAGCFEFLPDGQTFATSAGVSVQFHWSTAAGAGCPVAGFTGTPPQEGQLRVWDEGFTPATPECGSTSGNTKCPTEALLAHTCFPGTFCTDAACRAGANTWDVHNVRHFSRHGIGLECRLGVNMLVKVAKATAAPGLQTVTLRGQFTRAASPPPLNPVTDGAEISVFNTHGVVHTEFLPPGAYDPVTRVGWVLSRRGNKWTFKRHVTGAVARLTLADVTGDWTVVKMTARIPKRTVDTDFADPYTDAQLYLPAEGCYGLGFHRTTGCVLDVRGNVVCRQ